MACRLHAACRAPFPPGRNRWAAASARGYLQDVAPRERVTTPDAGRALDIVPDAPEEMYRLPEDRDTLSDATPPRSAGGMQATPGYTGPGSAKAQ
jgi:hypothetical protein